ncbi:MAG: hypothetical protein AAGI53_11010 [Planctomycetota bacterium]
MPEPNEGWRDFVTAVLCVFVLLATLAAPLAVVYFGWHHYGKNSGGGILLLAPFGLVVAVVSVPVTFMISGGLALIVRWLALRFLPDGPGLRPHQGQLIRFFRVRDHRGQHVEVRPRNKPAPFVSAAVKKTNADFRRNCEVGLTLLLVVLIGWIVFNTWYVNTFAKNLLLVPLWTQFIVLGLVGVIGGAVVLARHDRKTVASGVCPVCWHDLKRPRADEDHAICLGCGARWVSPAARVSSS